MEFHLMEFRFRSFPLSKFLKVPFPFVSVKTNFESSIKIPFPLMALCFRVNPYGSGSWGRAADGGNVVGTSPC